MSEIDGRFGFAAAVTPRAKVVGFVVLFLWRVLSPSQIAAEIVNIKLSMPGVQVSDFKISPDGQRVVYRAGQEPGTGLELYSVSIRGGESAWLSRPASPVGNDVGEFSISPYSRHVVFIGPYEPTQERTQLFSVPIEGSPSTPTRIADMTVYSGEVLEFQISPDSRRVVYLGQMEGPLDDYDLLSVPIEGPATASIPLNYDGHVYANLTGHPGFVITPDGGRVLFQSDQDTSRVAELFSVSIDGPASSAIKLNLPLEAGTPTFRRGIVEFFQLSADGSRVVYAATSISPENWGLYSVPADGPASAGLRLTNHFPPPDYGAGGVFKFLEAFRIAPDGQRVVYRADLDPDKYNREIFSVPIDGPAGAAAKLNGPIDTRRTGVVSFRISADNSRVAFTDSVWVYSAPIDGPASNSLNLNPSETWIPWNDLDITPDGSRVVYPEAGPIWSVPIAGPASVRVLLGPPTGVALTTEVFRISPDSSLIAYCAGEHQSTAQLYVVPVNGPHTAAVKYNGVMVSGGGIAHRKFEFSPDGQSVVYVADQETDGVSELYVSYFRHTATETWNGYR